MVFLNIFISERLRFLVVSLLGSIPLSFRSITSNLGIYVGSDYGLYGESEGIKVGIRSNSTQRE